MIDWLRAAVRSFAPKPVFRGGERGRRLGVGAGDEVGQLVRQQADREAAAERALQRSDDLLAVGVRDAPPTLTDPPSKAASTPGTLSEASALPKFASHGAAARLASTPRAPATLSAPNAAFSASTMRSRV